MTTHTPTPWKSQPGHTPTPWEYQPGFLTVYATPGLEDGAGLTTAIAKPLANQVTGGQAEAEANAAFIVRACNAYDNLTAAIENVLANFEDDSVLTVEQYRFKQNTAVVVLRAALAKAKGGGR